MNAVTEGRKVLLEIADLKVHLLHRLSQCTSWLSGALLGAGELGIRSEKSRCIITDGKCSIA